MAWYDALNPISSVMGGAGQFIGAIGGLSAEKKNYQLQKSQLDWQKMQWEETKVREDSAMQRRMADLQAAGMNPILAAGGSGASTQQAPVLDAPRRDAGQIQRSISSLIPVQMMQEIARTRAETDRIKAQAAVDRSQKNLIDSQAETEPYKRKQIIAQTMQTYTNEKISEIERKMKDRDFEILEGRLIGMRSDIKSGKLLDAYNVAAHGVDILEGQKELFWSLVQHLQESRTNTVNNWNGAPVEVPVILDGPVTLMAELASRKELDGKYNPIEVMIEALKIQKEAIEAGGGKDGIKKRIEEGYEKLKNGITKLIR